MSLEILLRDAVAGGQLFQPFSAPEATGAIARRDWPQKRVHSYLLRHCRGNLAATQVYFERVGYGRYRLLDAGATTRRRPAFPARRGWTEREGGADSTRVRRRLRPDATP